MAKGLDHAATTYTDEIAVEICEKLAAGDSLRAVCRELKICEMTVRRWVINDLNGFASHYTAARDLGLDVMADDVLDISDDGRNDWIEKNNKKGEKYIALNDEALARSRLRFDARRWYLSKLAPKKYGDRIHQEITNPDGSLKVASMDETQIATRLAAIFEKAKQAKDAADDPDGSDLV